jgi:hypothetical protein
MKQSSSHLPLHAKEVTGNLRVDKVIQMARGKLRAFVEESARWLNDVARYEQLMKNATNNKDKRDPAKPTNSRLSRQDMEIMEKLKKYEEEPDVKAWARVFSVPEWAKKRRRPICEPILNDYFDEKAIPTVRFRTPEQRRAIIARIRDHLRAKGLQTVAKCYDFAAYYDQLPLSKDVAKYFGVRSGGKSWTARTIPMGFRPSCAVAQAFTWAIIDFDVEDVIILSYIDNVAFIGSEAGVKKAAAIFERRCKEAGAVLSEAGDITQQFDFLGERFDLKAGTTQLTTKTTDKLQQVKEALNTKELRPTRREMAAIFGLNIFASGVASISLGDYYWPMTYLRRLHAEQAGWDDPAQPIDDNTLAILKDWGDALLTNKPVQLKTGNVDRATVPTIIVDASAWGWGAICLDGERTRIISERWVDEAERKKAEQSTYAEPTAALRAVYRLKLPTWNSVNVITDHSALFFVGNKGFARTFVYNEVVRKIRATFPSCTFYFVPGVKNPSDKISRGEAWSGDIAEIKKQTIDIIKSDAPQKQQTTTTTENGKTGEPPEDPEWRSTVDAPFRA